MQPLVFGSQSYQYLAHAVAACGGWAVGQVARTAFENGACGHRIVSAVRAKDVVLVGGTLNPVELQDVLRLASGVVRQGANSLTIVNPYMGTMRQEREAKPGDVVGAKLEANEFSALPRPPHGIRILLADLHCATIPSFFDDRAVMARQFYLEDVTLRAVGELGGDDFVLCGADLGGMKWILGWAKKRGWPWAINLKDRDGREVHGLGMIGDVRGKRAVIFDDIGQTLTTIRIAARTFLDNGASEVLAVFSHGVLSGNAIQELEAEGLVKKAVTTNSLPRAVELADGRFLEARDISRVIVENVSADWGW